MKKRLYSYLSTCETEEEVKSEFAKYCGFKIKTKQRFDHYSESILYEFKYQKNLKNINQRSKVIAQTLYYVRELKYGGGSKPLPPTICVVDKDEAFIFSTKQYEQIYKSRLFDWDRAPSQPCPKLVKKIEEFDFTSQIHIYDLTVEQEEEAFLDKWRRVSDVQSKLFESDKKEINEDNFYDVYLYWSSLFGKYVENGRKASEYFIADIEADKSILHGEGQVIFNLGDGDAKIKNLPKKDYDYFWSLYEKVSDIRVIYSIRQKIDRLSEDTQRRFTGEFYTPVEFAKKALKYIEDVAGQNWWEKGNWRLWDMAAGTGNLEFALPTSALKYCYLSTLLEDDAKYCKRIFPDATIFQYDYLNDDLSHLNREQTSLNDKIKMPKNLSDDLANPDIHWIIFINPPFATSNTAGGNTGKKSKDTVSITGIHGLMKRDNLGETSRELFAQFLYRISREFNGKEAYLGLFSKLKYINANNDQKLRDSFFHYKFEKGLMFSSEAFHGSKGKFPVGFVIWNLAKSKTLESQKIVLDVYNEDGYKYGTKRILNDTRDTFLSKWIERPRCSRIMPPLKSAITVGSENKDRRDRVADGFLFSLCAKGNDFQNQNYVTILSAPYVSAGAMSITEDNFEKGMIVHTVRRLPKADWTNDRDQYYAPVSDELPTEFIRDCVIWSAFSESNNTTSLKDVSYEGKIYQIPNNLYPFSLSEIKDWKCSNISDIALQIQSSNEDRFLAKWIAKNHLSKEAEDVVSAARAVYKIFYENISSTRWLDYKIALWDVGLWQIRMALTNAGIGLEELKKLKEANKVLGDKILPQLYELGFVPEGVLGFVDGEI